MKRQTSEGRSSSSTKSQQILHQRNYSGNITPTRANDPQQIPGVKKIISLSRNMSRNGPIKVISRELSPGHFSLQKTEPCESVYQSVRSPMNETEREQDIKGQKGAKGQKAALSLRSVSDQHLSEIRLKKPLSALDVKELKMKKTISLSINVDTANKPKLTGPKSATNSSGPAHFFEKNKTEVSEAIFERDEVDEEDKRDHYHYQETPELKVASADQTMIMNQLKARDESDSPLMPKIDNNEVYAFKLENPMMSDPVSSGLKIEFEGNSGSTKPSAFNRGTFMNEHITQTELEKQKEKKRLMKEALDLQLNEKKRKKEEEKMREREFSLKEEQRIKKEMALMNQQYEKETALEGVKKSHFKTEETENILTNQSSLKMSSPVKQIEKPEKHSSENDTRDTSVSSGNLHYINPAREEERILKSPAKVQRNTSSQHRDTVDSPPRLPNNINLLADENKKLRDENTKKGELIDALISALKHKDIGNFQNLHERSNLYSQSRRDDISSYPSSKTLKPLDIGEAELEALGYTFGYNQPKGKYRVVSEQPSEANRYDTRESNRPIPSEEKNFSASIYERMEREFQPRIVRPVLPDFPMEYTSNPPSKDNTPFYKPANSGLRNNEISALFGTSSTRVYSSPLANHLSQSSIVSPVHRTDSRNSPYLSFASQNNNYPSFGPLTLEPIKSLSLSSAVSPKGGYASNNQVMSPSGSTVIRIKKRNEHSVDFAELNRDNTREMRPPISFRAGFMNDEGSFSLVKPNRPQKREPNNQNYPPYNYGTQQPQKIEIIDTYQHPTTEDRNTSTTLETIHENESNLNLQPKILGKVIFSGNVHKKMSGGIGKEKWVGSEASKAHREELIEKIKALPALEGKPKFPKDVFSLNIRKKVCP